MLHFEEQPSLQSASSLQFYDTDGLQRRSPPRSPRGSPRHSLQLSRRGSASGANGLDGTTAPPPVRHSFHVRSHDDDDDVERGDSGGSDGADDKHALLEDLPVSSQLRLEFRNITCLVPASWQKPSLLGQAWRIVGAGGSAGAAPPKQKRRVLNDVSGKVLPGQVMALMGPSGSGKTSLLSILGGRAPNSVEVEGQVLVNGAPLTKAWRRRIGFVLQDDVLYETLTVAETLTYAGLLRLPRTMTRAAKLARVESVIEALGLSRSRDTLIGGFLRRGISGGERKRVSVGHELVINPALLMLDEPTSGLDSTTALHLVTMLRQLAVGGRAIITTIHQPASRLFKQLDRVMLLAEGSCMYYGQADQAVTWFEHFGYKLPRGISAADFILDVSLGEGPGKLQGPSAVQQLCATFKAWLQQHMDGFEGAVQLQGVQLLLPAPPLAAADGNGTQDGGRHGMNGSKVWNSHSGGDPARSGVAAEKKAGRLQQAGQPGDARGTASGGKRSWAQALLQPCGGLCFRPLLVGGGVSQPGTGGGGVTATAIGGAAASAAAATPAATGAGEAAAPAAGLGEVAPCDVEAGPEPAGCCGGGAREGASYLDQVVLLTSRAVKVRRLQSLSAPTLVQTLLTAVIASLMWWQRGRSNTVSGSSDVLGLIFFAMMFPCFRSLFDALFTFPSELRILSKERPSGLYRLSAYYLARTASDLPIELAFPLIFITVIYWGGGLRPSAGGFVAYVAAQLLLVLVAQAWGLLLGSAFMDPKIAQTVTTVLMMTFILVSGFYTKMVPSFISWTRYLSFYNWGNQLLVKIQFRHQTLVDCGADDSAACTPVADVQTALRLSFNPSSSVWSEVVVLLAMLLVLRVATYIVLRRKTAARVTAH